MRRAMKDDRRPGRILSEHVVGVSVIAVRDLTRSPGYDAFEWINEVEGFAQELREVRKVEDYSRRQSKWNFPAQRKSPGICRHIAAKKQLL